jgi:hypothetical protein
MRLMRSIIIITITIITTSKGARLPSYFQREQLLASL